MSITIWSNDNQSAYELGNTTHNPKSYRCHLAIIKDDEDLYSVIVLNLPGAGSSGSTEEEAINRVRELVPGMVEAYMEEQGEIPWLTPENYDIPEGAMQKWILVNA